MKNKSSFDNELRLRILTRHQALTLVLLSLGTTQPTMMYHRVGFRLPALIPHRILTPVPQFHGTTRVTLMPLRLVMAIFQTTPQRKKPSSITVITSAVRLTSQMTMLTSPSMMPTCHTVNSL